MAALKRLSGGALHTRTQNQAPYQPAVLQQLATAMRTYLHIHQLTMDGLSSAPCALALGRTTKQLLNHQPFSASTEEGRGCAGGRPPRRGARAGIVGGRAQLVLPPPSGGRPRPEELREKITSSKTYCGAYRGSGPSPMRTYY